MEKFVFKKYPSIDNSYRTKTINQIIRHGFDKEEWCVLLKVHGANFSIWTDGKILKCAKRTSFIKNNENFCSWQNVVNDIQMHIFNAFEDIKEMYPDTKEVVFCGELAGGEYPHPKVKKPDTTKRVQKGVFYAPFNFFYIFDILVDGRFLNHNTVVNICKEDMLIVAEPLKIGSFIECLEYPNEFEDPMYKMFGLPKLTKEMIGRENICEGVVLKPIEPKFFGNGSRCILKNKNDKFKENNGERKNKAPKKQHVWSVEGAKLFSLLATYISENRLRNVLSHGIDISDKKKAFGNIMKEFNIDVWDDFIKDNSDEYECLTEKERKLIKKALNPMCAEIIRNNFQNILDNEF